MMKSDRHEKEHPIGHSPRDTAMKEKCASKARRTPSQPRSKEKVAMIHAAAAELFSLHGYASTSTNKIARKAGISIGSLYQYFPGKDMILVSLRERHLEETKDFLQAVFEGIRNCEVIDKTFISLVLRLVIELNIENRLQCGISPGHGALPQPLADQQRDFNGFIMMNIEQALRKNPHLRIGNPAVSSFIIFKTTQHLIRDYCLHHADEIDQEEFIEEMAEMLNRYLTHAQDPL
jgi:AcrR family transcriptional regulator